jgi:YVTN family beta-propeller protein
VSVNPDGSSFTYTPNEGFTGTDTFQVTASDVGRHLHLQDFSAPLSGLTARDSSTRYSGRTPPRGRVTVTVGAEDVSTILVGDRPTGVAIHPDGTRVYVTNAGEGTVDVIDIANHHSRRTITVGQNPVAVAISPDGSQAWVLNEADQTITVIDTAHRHRHGDPISIAFGSDGRAYVVNPVNVGTDNSPRFIPTITVYNPSTRAVVGSLDDFSRPPLPPRANVAASPTRPFVFITNPNTSSVAVIDTTRLDIARSFTLPMTQPQAVAVLEVGNAIHLYVTDPETDTLHVIDAATGNAIVDPIPVGSNPRDITIQGNRAYVTDAEGNRVAVIGTDTNTMIR